MTSKTPSGNLTTASLKRIFLRGGAKISSASAIEVLRPVAEKELAKVLVRSVVFRDADKNRKVLMGRDVEGALKHLGYHIGNLDVSSGKAPIEGKYKVGKKASKHGEHRYRAGTVALRTIKKVQGTDDVLIPEAPFKRFVRGMLADITGQSKEKISTSAFNTLHLFIEDYLVSIATASVDQARHAKRVTVDGNDVLMVLRTRCDARGAGCKPHLIN